MLYIVGLPIGNLSDISLRALDTLKSVDIIACEDTRNTIKLLNHFEIKKKLIAYHKFNEKEMSPKIVEMLKAGSNIALVSDAGMPVISDPGNILINSLKENALEYTVIPGASASLSALILSGFDNSKFTFLGFLPEKNSERTEFLNEVKAYKTTLIFYISPYDLKKNVDDIFKIFGKRKACLIKEITKIHESTCEFYLGDDFEINEKGEFVLVVEGSKEDIKPNSDLSIEEQINLLVSRGTSENQAISKVAKNNNMTKQELYKKLKVK